MTHHTHRPSHEPWENLPTGFAEHLEIEARLSAPIRSAALERAITALDAVPTNIVDLGSGTGADAVALAQRFPSARVHAIDVSTELLDRVTSSAAAAGVVDRIDRHLADLNSEWSAEIPQRVDLAWASLSLHHVDDPRAVLRRVFASLRPGGVFVLTELSGEWAQLLTEAGFTSVKGSEHEFTARADTADGARYLELRESRTSDVAHSADRTVWVAVRPEAEPAGDTIEADVVVLGGGPAGLAASIALARSRRKVVVIDAGHPRNAPAEGAHNVLGNEGVSPLELLIRGRAEAETYGVQIVSGTVSGVSGAIDDFSVEVGEGSHRLHARRIILATGLVDDLPEIPGIEEGWGRSVLHCPFCHGWEVQGHRIGIIARGEAYIHQAMLFAQLSDQVTVFLHETPEPNEEQLEQLAALGVPIVRSRVQRLRMDDTQVRAVELEDGSAFDLDAVVVAPRFNARTDLFEVLGGVAEETPFGRQIPSDPRGMTDVPGVWAAGNAAQPMAMVVGSAASGVTAGAGVHGDLAFADLNRAVQERRVSA